MIETLYKSKNADTCSNITRFVALCCSGRYKWCVRNNDTGYDVLQGCCDAEDLPQDIVEKCHQVGYTMFYACEWPFNSV